MPSPTESIRNAIDESMAPLIADYRTFLADVNEPFLPVSKSDLHYLFDQYGNQLLDFGASLAPVGHNHPFVIDAVREHLDFYVRTGEVGRHVLRWPVEYAANLAKSFADEDAETFPQIQFTEGEREAVRLALALDRRHDLGFAMLNTGMHDWLSVGRRESIPLVDLDKPPEHFRYWQHVNSLLISMVCDDGHVVDPEWLLRLTDLARTYEVKIIVDESRTGFGRLGTMWGHQSIGLVPDLTILGGPVGGGFALGAVVAMEAVWHHSGAHWSVSPQAGSPVACAAGAGVLRAINPGVLEHVKEAGGTFDHALQELVSQFGEYPARTHGMGLWRTLEFKTSALANSFVVEARKRGLLLAPPVGSSIVLNPTLIASEMELVRGVDLMADTLLDWQTEDNA